MPEVPTLTPHKVIRVLEKRGFVLSRVKGIVLNATSLTNRSMGGNCRSAHSFRSSGQAGIEREEIQDLL